MIRKSWFVFLVAMLVFTGVAGQVPSALAQDCDQVVIDETGRLSQSDLAKVMTAAQDLTNKGADVRVRVVSGFHGHGNIDQLEQATIQGCSSLQAPDGGRKNNLVMVFVAPSQRKSGIFFGGQWTSRLKYRYMDIQTDEMNPRFRDGDLAGGIVAGLNAIGEIIATPIAATPTAAPITVNTKPVDLSGLWVFLGWALAIIAFFIILYCIRKIVKETGERRDASRAAQQKAKAAQGSCSSLILMLNDPNALSVLRAKLTKAAGQMPAGVEDKLLPRFEAIGNRIKNAMSDFSTMNSSGSTGNPEKEGLSPEQYETMEGNFRQLKQTLERIREDRDQLASEIEDFSKLVESVPSALSQATQSLTDATAAIAAVAAKGFKTETIQSNVTAAQAKLKQAQASLTAKQYADALKAAGEAQVLGQKANKQAFYLPGLKTTIEDSITTAKARIATVTALIGQARTIFTAISTTYAESCWTTVRGNGTEAEKRIASATGILEQAAQAISMEQQAWSSGTDLVTQANTLLDQAESYLRSISTLKDNLEAAKAGAAKEIDAAASDIETAHGFIHLHDADIRESLEGNLNQAAALVTQAKAILATTQPDYLAVVKLARQAHASADTVLAEAHQEYDVAERQRQKAANLLRDAKHAVDTTREFIEDHRGDVHDDARKYLTEATSALGFAQAAKSTEVQITFSQKAENEAEKALSLAQGNFESAESARQEARRAAQRRREEAEREEEEEREDRDTSFVTGAIVGAALGSGGGGSHHHHDDSFSSGGGGGSSWGFGGGGGSISFGGSSGGGGSSGW